ncbi:hypothetical protein L1049_011975 [Liquidambar formosana]|uniref:Exostosin GT47 domain-containing protein n=1 Tax=Liquidambar formosana TaxID=63359 RepID=A0AAP0RSB4_LIQFO
MPFIKQPRPANPCTERYKCLILFISAWFLLLFFWFPPKTTQPPHNPNTDSKTTTTIATVPTCEDGIASVYVYDLPPEFNLRLVQDCRHLNVFTDMCPYVANSGLGQPVSEEMGSTTTSWFATHQFIAEMIFHARMKNHPCRTLDPALADLFFVPFYGGLHVSSKFREPDLMARDALAIKLAEHLSEQPWWQRHHGKDHILVLGRTAWDFMRSTRGPDIGANCLLNLPVVRNMSVLTVERHPWSNLDQHGIPYSSCFHPSTKEEMLTWQQEVGQSERPHLFSFIGNPRNGSTEAGVIRGEIMRQCAESTRCKLVRCVEGWRNCYAPGEVMKVMRGSQFCLQAPGDSFTRRSTFDSVLAGCIPVFFSRHTAYTQYAWFFPADPSAYSVYIEGNATRRIEEVLLKIPTETVQRMRSRVIDMIPTITYAHPNKSDSQFRDAVDVALAALSKHVHSKLQLHDQ